MILYILLVGYVLFSVFIFFLVNSNIFPNRRYANYSIDIPATLKFAKEGSIAYWAAHQKERKGAVILLHGFTRNSGKMNSRAKLYWDLGYDVYLIDNLAHGKSASIFFPSGIEYSWLVYEVIRAEKIENPLIHGVSMGAIAAAYISQKRPNIVSAVICEALPESFDNLYKEMMRFLKVPYLLFFWIDWISRKVVWRKFRYVDYTYDLTEINCPMFLISSSNDPMFNKHDHYDLIVEKMQHKPDFQHWLVDNARHTNMNLNPKYPRKLRDFLSSHYN